MSVSKRQLEEREMRKERILDGALEVFKSKGLDGATMDEIAIESGFGKATLYYYFNSKEEVFTAILTNGWQNLWASLEPVIADYNGPRKTFVNVLIKIAENAQNRPGLFEFLFNAKPFDESAIIFIDCKILCIISGLKTFNSKWP